MSRLATEGPRLGSAVEVVDREAKISVDAFEAEDATRDGGRNKDGAAECGRETCRRP